MLTSPTHLRDELIKLDKDLAGLPGRRVALIGFRDANVKRIDDNLRTLGQTAGWTVVDQRDAGLARAPEPLIQALEAPKLALVVDALAALPTNATMLIRALHDSQDSVSWSNGVRSALPARRILYVVAVGARWAQDLPGVLQRIDYMIFIRAPK